MAKLKGTGAPTRTTQGAIGDIYTDTKNGKQYECIFAYRTSADDEFDCQWVEKKIEKKAEEKPVEPVVEPEQPEQPVVEEEKPEEKPVEPVVEPEQPEQPVVEEEKPEQPAEEKKEEKKEAPKTYELYII